MPAPSQIRILPDVVANQIAAGEVVERPASALKELIENSLDAGASRILAEVADGGRKLISVTDDGSGMGRDDALLSIERHATSKIHEAADLAHIATLGFRGEALAAIASVSQFTLTTRTAEALGGVEVLVFGGKIQEVREVGCPVGTQVQVRNLFFNIPARRKFLRSAQTEFIHIKRVFTLAALSRPATAFQLRVDAADMFQLPAANDMLERLNDFYGAEFAAQLRPLDFDAGNVRITGFAARPSFTRADREEQIVFVNHRAATAPVINYAIASVYQNLVPGGRYAPVFIHVHLPAELVDVNVHPTKREVRFHRPMEVREAVADAIRSAISGISSEAARTTATPRPPGHVMPPRPEQPFFDTFRAFPAPRPAPAPAAAPRPPVPTPAPGAMPAAAMPAGSPWAWFRILGRVGGIYVVLETNEGLVLLDPRAAHERIIYEHVLQLGKARPQESQGLLPPVTVELSARDAQALRRHLDALRAMGFSVAEFGADAFLVDAVPAIMSEISPALLLTDLASALVQSGAEALREGWMHERIAEISGQRAVTTFEELAETELYRLVEDLARTEMPYTSPRGRPTVILLNMSELHRKFGRS